MQLPLIILVGIGGFCGSITRFLINSFFWRQHFFPFGTLLVNTLGSCLVGFMLFNTKEFSPLVRMFSVIGFAGALTTMSTFALETVLLFESQNTIKALINIFANIVCSISAIYVGKYITKFF